MNLRIAGAVAAAALLIAAGSLTAGARERGTARSDGPPIKMPGTIAGKVIHVEDGDTLTVLDEAGHKRVIRLTDIDAPETSHGSNRPGQPYSAKAKTFLKSITLGQPAQANCYDIDARKRDDGSVRERYICRVMVDGQDANMAMVDSGLAMAYRHNPRFVRDSSTLLHEEVARKARLGLWAQESPLPPWEWRRACWERKQCGAAGE